MELTEGQLRTLRHILGIDTPFDRTPKPYRNYAAVDVGNKEFYELERLGAVEIYRPRARYDWYRCTPAGRDAAMASHKAIRHRKAKRVYHAYLRLRDAWGELTFREFLTSAEFSDVRKEA